MSETELKRLTDDLNKSQRLCNMLIEKLHPGSVAAGAAGCTCPVIDNRRGFGCYTDKDGHPVFIYSADCPVHTEILLNNTNYSRLYLDADTTPYEAATLILAAMGPVYVNELIDALVDVLQVQPNRDKEP